MTIRKYHDADLDGMIAIWNEVVEAGDAFPQEEPLTLLKAHGVEAVAEKTVPKILNRDLSDSCPMEQTVDGIDDPAEMVKALKSRLGI